MRTSPRTGRIRWSKRRGASTDDARELTRRPRDWRLYWRSLRRGQGCWRAGMLAGWRRQIPPRNAGRLDRTGRMHMLGIRVHADTCMHKALLPGTTRQSGALFFLSGLGRCGLGVTPSPSLPCLLSFASRRAETAGGEQHRAVRAARGEPTERPHLLFEVSYSFSPVADGSCNLCGPLGGLCSFIFRACDPVPRVVARRRPTDQPRGERGGPGRGRGASVWAFCGLESFG